MGQCDGVRLGLGRDRVRLKVKSRVRVGVSIRIGDRFRFRIRGASTGLRANYRLAIDKYPRGDSSIHKPLGDSSIQYAPA